ncbi:TerB family tellurite resistance protein [Albimonas pacifica]|uniref:DnaJ like chaperone protein n=1 Tax=Albimonas pacifica TaxID=1114924 RepID=A0A1I3F3N4_9RHOB|nr:TerB family tellurite resistance protein [Albimonas pacifica]SFI05411.1 DnaJ like chaperone protein [Albimonas pacifica]
MSIWTRIAEALRALREGESFADVFERLKTPPEQTAGFAIAVIALGAKMAKADGQVTRDEVAAFREVFHIPPSAERQAARIFNMARTDVAGFEGYAASVARMFGDRKAPLEDLLEGLFHVAAADGEFHPDEEAFLREVWRLFALPERVYRTLHARYAPGAAPDPYEVLGVRPEDSDDKIRRAWRKLVRETHPDRMIARGVPEEAVRLATQRLAAVNDAYDEIMQMRQGAHA